MKYGFGYFGRGYYIPPPSAPAPQAPTYQKGKWVCDSSAKPVATGNQQAYCCPSSWVISNYNDPAPCRNEQDFYDCGPLPPNSTRANAVCCNRAQQWFAKDSTGADPCAAFNLKPSDILAPDVTPTSVAQQETIFTPGMMMIVGLAMALMFVLTLVKDED